MVATTRCIDATYRGIYHVFDKISRSIQSDFVKKTVDVIFESVTPYEKSTLPFLLKIIF